MLVIKMGGAAGVDVDAVCGDIAWLAASGEIPVLVHGGSAEADALGRRLGHPPRSLTSPDGAESRYTDTAALEALTMATAGRVQPLLVTRLLARGVRACGLLGVDAGVVRARRKRAVRAVVDGRVRIVRDNRAGSISHVDVDLLWLLLRRGYLPVLAPPALDVEEGPVNVDADRLAAAVAAALRADGLVLLSNVPGLLRDPADPHSRVTRVGRGDLQACFDLARGRMKLKLAAVREALSGGVGWAVIADGRVGRPVRTALTGGGTTVGPEALAEEVAR